MFLATIPAVLYIDRLGRKPVLAVGALGMAFSHFVIAVILAKNFDNFENHRAAGWAAVVMVWLFVIHFGYSWGPCAWILIAGKFPLHPLEVVFILTFIHRNLASIYASIRHSARRLLQLDEQLHHRTNHARAAREHYLGNLCSVWLGHYTRSGVHLVLCP